MKTMQSILLSSLVLLGVLAELAVVFGAEPCKHRGYGHESTVCVCDEKSCDTLDPIKKSEPGIIQTFSTSRGGDRFAREELKFEQALGVDKYMILLHPDQKMQKIIGFGSTITDCSGRNFMSLSEKLRQNLVRDYFSDQGIEYSMLKVPIGDTNMSMRRYSLDMARDDDFDFEHWKLEPEDLNYKIPFLKMVEKSTAAADRPVKLFATAFTAPSWMKKKNLHDDGGVLKLGPGGRYYKAFAQYVMKFMKAYEERNFTWWGMTILNAPALDEYESVNMPAEQQRDFIKLDLAPELKKNGFDKIKLMIFDWSIREMKLYCHKLLHDKEAAKYVSGIAFHWYTMVDYVRKYIQDVHEEWPDKFILSTMSSEDFYTDSLGSWHTAQHYADEIIKCMRFYVTGWVDRNLIVDTKGGPTYTITKLNSAIVVNASAGEYYKQPLFYVLGHFSKFLPEDSVQLNYTVSRELNEYDLIAFQRPDGGRVMIIINLTYYPLNFTIVDPEHGMVKVPVKEYAIKTLLWY